MLTVKNRTALICGATGYEGLGAIKALVAGGMNVVISSQHGFEVAEKLLASDEIYRTHCMVVRQPDGLEYNYKKVYERFGSLDVIIPNQGGHFSHTPLEDITQEDLYLDLQRQNFISLDMVRCALPYLKESKAGRVILMANVGARTGLLEEGLCQSVSRGGVISMTYTLARELAPYGITVNCIARGGMVGEDDTEKLLDKMPLGRPGTDVEFGAAVEYFASEEAGFVTGQVLNLCGGLYMG